MRDIGVPCSPQVMSPSVTGIFVDAMASLGGLSEWTVRGSARSNTGPTSTSPPASKRVKVSGRSERVSECNVVVS